MSIYTIKIKFSAPNSYCRGKGLGTRESFEDNKAFGIFEGTTLVLPLANIS